MTGLEPRVLTEPRIADAFYRAGFGRVQFPEPPTRCGDGVSFMVELPAGTPEGRLKARKPLVFAYLDVSPDSVYVEQAIGYREQRFAVWIHDGDWRVR